MSPSRRRKAPRGRTYFVGRRVSEGTEVYAVTATDVERLRPARRHEVPGLDWHGSSSAKLELSQLLISRAIERRPSRELQSRFALYVLDQLPHRGFVLDVEEVWHWLRLDGGLDDFASDTAPRRSLPERLRGLFGGAPVRGAHA